MAVAIELSATLTELTWISDIASAISSTTRMRLRLYRRDVPTTLTHFGSCLATAGR